MSSLKVSGALTKTYFNKYDYVILNQKIPTTLSKKQVNAIDLSYINTDLMITFDYAQVCGEDAYDLVTYVLPVSKGQLMLDSKVNYMYNKECEVNNEDIQS